MTPKTPHDINKYSDLFEELTGIYPLNVRGALATDGRDVVIFKIVEENMIGVRYHMNALPYIEMSIPDKATRTINVSYFVDTLLEAKYKRDERNIAPNEPVFTPKMARPSPVVPPLPAELYTVAYEKYGACCVAAVFTTREKAEAYADARNKEQKQRWGSVLDEYYCDDTLKLDPSI